MAGRAGVLWALAGGVRTIPALAAQRDLAADRGQSGGPCRRRRADHLDVSVDSYRVYGKQMAEREGFEPPCRLPDKTLSRRPRYDHFGTSPFTTTLGPPLRVYARRYQPIG